MKPYLRPEQPRERRFNYKLSAIRTLMTENVIGLWKRRFPALKMGLRTNLKNSCNVIIATAVLHNISILWKEPCPEDNQDEEDDQDPEAPVPPDVSGRPVRLAGQIRRDWMRDKFCQT
jgi:hypothetical protein